MSENLKATLAIIAWSVIFPLIVIVFPQKMDESKIWRHIKGLISLILFFDVILFSIGFVLYEVYSFCVEIHYMINVQEQKLNTEISPVKLNLLIENNGSSH